MDNNNNKSISEIFSDIADIFYKFCIVTDDMIEAHKAHARAIEMDKLAREYEGR